MALLSVAEFLGQIYYRLTAYLPRRLPATLAQFDRFKNVLIYAYGVPDEPQVWIAVSGQITSTPASRLRKPWGEIANAAKRLQINGMAEIFKRVAIAELEEKLKAAAARVAEEASHDTESEKQPEADAGPSPLLS